MPGSVDQDNTRFLVRLEGEIGLADAAELKVTLIEGLASKRKLHLEMRCVGAIDVTFMQLLEAVLREACGAGVRVVLSLSEPADMALRGAGFGNLIDEAERSE